MGRAINLRELKARYDELGGDRAVAMLGQLMDDKKLRPDDFSLRDLCEAFCGSEYLRAIDPRRKSGRAELREAINAVDTSAFSNITGQVMFNAVKEGYTNATMIADQLCTTMQTSFLDGEKIPGIGESGDEAEIIGEGNEYPTVGLNEEYVEAPATVKRGFILPVTREAIVADRTGILVQRARDSGKKYLGINKEKRVLDVVTGQTNNYKRNGTSTNTYLTAGAYINDKTSNALTDWTNIQTAELLFDAITDPNTGEPVLFTPNAIIVPTALKRTAYRIFNATDIRFGDGASNSTAAYGPNPLRDGPQVTIFSSPYVKLRTSSATKWFYGNPKEAFRYSEVWGIEPVEAPDNNELMFTRDIWMRFKISERGVAWAYEPRAMTRNDQ